MKMLGVIIILAASSLTTAADAPIKTRAEIFAPVNRPDLRNQDSEYSELDLNGDGIDELIMSGPMSFHGTGGLTYTLYRGLGDEKYEELIGFLAGPLALEDCNPSHEKHLWGYSHRSCRSGIIFYFSFDRKGVFQGSPSLEIYPGDMGTEMGNSIYRSIFNEKTILKMIKLPQSVAGESSQGVPSSKP